MKHTLNIEIRNKRKKITLNPITLGGSFLTLKDVYKGEVYAGNIVKVKANP